MANSANIKTCFIPTEVKKYDDYITMTIEETNQTFLIRVKGIGIKNNRLLDLVNIDEYEEYVNEDIIEAQYIDFDMKMPKNPNTNDVPRKTDADAVMQSIKNILLNNRLWYSGNIDIYGLIFKNIDSPFQQMRISETLKDTILNYEPRLGLLDIKIDNDIYDNKQVNINVSFSLENNKDVIYDYPMFIKIR